MHELPVPSTFPSDFSMGLCCQILTNTGGDRYDFYQQSPSEAGYQGLLSGCWGFCLCVLVVCFFVFCFFFFFVRLCLQGQYCDICNLASKVFERLI